LIRVSLKSYKADEVRYAAYAVSGSAYVFLEPGKKGEIAVTLEPKRGGAGQGTAALEKWFIAELKDEKMRSAIADSNRELRDFMVLKALTSVVSPPPSEDSGFTAAQEKELDDLIAQVEREIKTESAGKEYSDPLGLTKTWEEKHDANSAKGKSRK